LLSEMPAVGCVAAHIVPQSRPDVSPVLVGRTILPLSSPSRHFLNMILRLHRLL